METELKLRKFEVERDTKSARVRNNLRLINKSLGIGYDIPACHSWVEICRDILKDGTNPKTLSRVARGQLKSTNGWEATILD